MPPFSSDLVTGTKLLTREEECTLKTALAFVVIKTRAKARAKAKRRAIASEAIRHSNTACENHHSSKKQRITDYSATATDGAERKHDSGGSIDIGSSTAFDTSILDHLFRRRGNISSGSASSHQRGIPRPRRSRSLECTGGRIHIDHMFRAAKTLAETWLVTDRNRNQSQTMVTSTKALAGATGHLAHQLQLLLVAKSTADGVHDKSTSTAKSASTSTSTSSSASTSTSVTQSSQSLATPKDRGKKTPRMRYRRPSLSSKVSATDSTSTPSSSSRTGAAAAAAAVMVTPASNHKQNDGSNLDENSHGNRTMEAVFHVQKWIRSTLLQQEDHPQQFSATNVTETRLTILSCQNTTVRDVLASFHVYVVMIPQIVRISPPLIGHVFQVVARLVKDLYSDKITVAGEDAALWDGSDGDVDGERELPTTDRNGHARQLLNHLATSALNLLELCWTTKIVVGRRRSAESHRSFLLGSLQEILGDLLVPLSRSELSGEHYRLTVSSSRHRTFQHRQYQGQLVRQQKQHHGGFSRSSETQNHRSEKQQQQQSQQRRRVLKRLNQFLSESEPAPHVQTFRKPRGDALPLSDASARDDTRSEKATSTKTQTSRISLPPRSCRLDPEAKLLLRMAVYRLILLGKKE